MNVGNSLRASNDCKTKLTVIEVDELFKQEQAAPHNSKNCLSVIYQILFSRYLDL